MNEYTVPKPAYPVFLKLLTGLVVTGLFGLGLVAYETFNLVHGPVVALIFSIVIEVGAAIDAVGLAGGIKKDTWWLIPAILITIIVSGWYNYSTVAVNGAALKITDEMQLEIVLHAIAWGPLASLAFMSLGVGFKIAAHERDVKAWEENRQKWTDEQIAKAHQLQQDAETKRLQLDFQKRKLELETQAKIAEAQAVEDRKAEIARTRLELKAERDRELPGQGGRTSIEASRGTYQDFVNLLANNGTHDYTNRELAGKLHVTTRTITEWRAKRNRETTEVIQNN